MADTKKVRSIEERKEAMLAELAELEARQLEKYKKELAAKNERLDKVSKTIAKAEAEAEALETRIAELNELITELEADADDDAVAAVEAIDEQPVLEYSNV